MRSYSVPPEIYDQSLPQIITAKKIVDRELQTYPFKGDEIILDVGCGTGLLAEHLSQRVSNGAVIGLDVADNMLQYARGHHQQENIYYRHTDATEFEKIFQRSADIIVCSWTVSHIPAEKQMQFTANLFQYLKEDGKLIITFPVSGSQLSQVLNDTIASNKWKYYFVGFENKRSSYTASAYQMLLREHDFINCVVDTSQEKMLLTKTQATHFVTTAAARYLSRVPIARQEEFIADIVKLYQEKTNAADDCIPYEVTMLTAVAMRPSFQLLMQANMFSGRPTVEVAGAEFVMRKLI